MYRSLTTTAPRASAGRITSATCSARSAAMSRASVRGSIPPPPRTSPRIDAPTSVAPGSRVATTSRPASRSRPTSRAAWVLLPDPSPPSRTTKMPLVAIAVGRVPRPAPGPEDVAADQEAGCHRHEPPEPEGQPHPGQVDPHPEFEHPVGEQRPGDLVEQTGHP